MQSTASTGPVAIVEGHMNAQIRMVVVDSRPLVRWALTHIASTSPDLHLAGETESADDAINLVFSLQPTVVTIDCSLPDGQGWRLVHDLRKRDAELGVVVLCSDGSDEQLFRALDAGASAFLAKDAAVNEVIGAIRHAAVAPTSFTALGMAQALRRRHQTSDRLALSKREREVLALLRQGRSVPEVASTLFVSLSTAKTYVARLYEKLGANNRAQALMTAVELGIFDIQTAVAV